MELTSESLSTNKNNNSSSITFHAIRTVNTITHNVPNDMRNYNLLLNSNSNNNLLALEVAALKEPAVISDYSMPSSDSSQPKKC